MITLFEKVLLWAIALFILASVTYKVTETLPVKYEPMNKVHSDQIILLVMDGLRANNPNVGETCIVLAANLLVGDYSTVEHMMPVHGKCATKIIGLYVSKEHL